MLRMFRTINGQVEQIQKPENGSWLCLSDPTDVELANVSMETGVDLADLRAPLDDEERSRVDVEDDYTMIIVDIPTVEERGGRDWYETIPLSIIITQSAIITVCMQDTPVLHPFMEGTIRGFNTYMKTRFILQILYRNATMYLRYLRIIDRESDKLELPLGAIPIPERPRIIILNKVDMPEAKELAEFVKPEFEKLGLNVYVISTASHEGLKELNWALAAMVADMRKEVAKREQAEEETRVVIKPLEEPRNRRRRNDEGGTALDFTVERKEAGNGDVWYEVLGTKPERWVMQTNFDNDEAVGYLADRLAKLGVEDELRNKGAKPGDEVRIGKGARAVEFDWDPTIAAGAEMLDGAQLGARGVDLRLQEQDGRSQRRTNAERRRQYHEMMDARQAVREAMMAERKAGHWADPSVDDDRHDETSLFGRGETTDSENVEQ